MICSLSLPYFFFFFSAWRIDKDKHFGCRVCSPLEPGCCWDRSVCNG